MIQRLALRSTFVLTFLASFGGRPRRDAASTLQALSQAISKNSKLSSAQQREQLEALRGALAVRTLERASSQLAQAVREQSQNRADLKTLEQLRGAAAGASVKPGKKTQVEKAVKMKGGAFTSTPTQVSSRAELDALIAELEEQRDKTKAAQELNQARINAMLKKQNEVMQLMTEVQRRLNETLGGVAQNIK